MYEWAHETFVHNDYQPEVLNYACILMDRQKECPPYPEKCKICKIWKYHPYVYGKLDLDDLDTNKPLPEHFACLRVVEPTL